MHSIPIPLPYHHQAERDRRGAIIIISLFSKFQAWEREDGAKARSREATADLIICECASTPKCRSQQKARTVPRKTRHFCKTTRTSALPCLKHTRPLTQH